MFVLHILKFIYRKFEDIFDVDHFIDYLKDDVRIVRDIPEWFTDKSELFSSIRLGSFTCFMVLMNKIMIILTHTRIRGLICCQY